MRKQKWKSTISNFTARQNYSMVIEVRIVGPSGGDLTDKDFKGDLWWAELGADNVLALTWMVVTYIHLLGKNSSL